MVCVGSIKINLAIQCTLPLCGTDRSRVSSVVIVTRLWGLNDLRIVSLALGPIQPSIQWIPGARWAGREAHLSLLYSTVDKNEWSCTAAPPARLQQLHTSSTVTARLHRPEVSAIRLGCEPPG